MMIAAVKRVQLSIVKIAEKWTQNSRSLQKDQSCIYTSRRIRIPNVTARFCRCRGWERWGRKLRLFGWESHSNSSNSYRALRLQIRRLNLNKFMSHGLMLNFLSFCLFQVPEDIPEVSMAPKLNSFDETSSLRDSIVMWSGLRHLHVSKSIPTGRGKKGEIFMCNLNWNPIAFNTNQALLVHWKLLITDVDFYMLPQLMATEPQFTTLIQICLKIIGFYVALLSSLQIHCTL